MGLSVILIDQNAALISGCVDEAHAMDKGRIVTTLTSDESRDESRLTDVLSLLITSDPEDRRTTEMDRDSAPDRPARDVGNHDGKF